MEIAGISRAFPGRFRPGIGLGLPEWLRQMGFMPEKPVAALRESVGSIRRLLAGETVSLDGTHFSLDRIGITHPATEGVPIAMGVSGPMLLRLAGQLADTTLFAASAGTGYFRFARAEVEKGLRKGRPPARRDGVLDDRPHMRGPRRGAAAWDRALGRSWARSWASSA